MIRTENEYSLLLKQRAEEYKIFKERPVAYFCAEFAIENSLPIYAGGLGVLAGDYLIEAAKQDFPVVAVGLRYKYGQWHKRFSDLVGKKGESGFDLDVALDKNHQSVLVEVPIFGRSVYARAWRYKKGSVTLYLLDTDVEENTDEDERITDYLYADNRSVRLMQEILLGIGGYRLLQQLDIKPSVYHLNEGHSAFVSLELASEEIKKSGGTLTDVFDRACTSVLFTNHTLITAGHEIFDQNLVSLALNEYARQNSLKISDLADLGKAPGVDGFSMTAFAMRAAQSINAVSKLHSEKASALWQRPDVVAVTNGISTDRWDNTGESGEPDLATAHVKNKERLLAFIFGTCPSAGEWDNRILLAGWARRLVPYKRPMAMLEDIATFKKLATQKGRELRLVFSGPFDQDNSDKNPYVEELLKLSLGELRGLIAPISNYSVEIAELMTSGCDVWLNTPEVGREACGTSGMKAALNGTLPVSTNDGWVYEADLKGSGWIAEDENINKSLINLFEKEIIPTYYDTPARWEKMQTTSRDLILPRFTATRMLYEYIEKLYLPIVEACKKL